MPAKADIQKQNEFYHNTLEPLMEKASQGKCALLFLDASHFVIGCDFLGKIYSKTRKFMRTFSGRQRYNVLGAIDFVSKKVHTVTNDSYITATQVCELLRKVSAQYAGQEVHIVLDNARYQKCKIVQDLALELDITLDYVPSYSPNLNLIERFWKFVKNEVRVRHYDDFATFKARIDEAVASSTGANRRRVSTLIGEKVQLFDNVNICGAAA